MCDPVTIGSLAVGAIGSGISGYEASQNQSRMQGARNASTMEEVARSRAYGDKSRAAFDNSLDVYSPANQAASLSGAQSSIGDVLTRNTPVDVGRITTANAPRVVGASEEARLGDVFAKAGSANQRLATLKGYDQNQFDNKMKTNDNARTIDMYGDFARTSAGVNAIEQRAAAQNAYRPSSGIGELLSFAGSVGANQAGRGTNLFKPSIMQAPMTRLPGLY